MGVKQERDAAEVDKKFATKRDIENLKKDVFKLIADWGCSVGDTNRRCHDIEVEVEGLQDDIADLSVSIAEDRDRLDKLETQVAQNKPVSSSDEWYKYREMRECIHSIGEAIKKYNGR
jgi:predicted TPR repeat methyltransferase